MKKNIVHIAPIRHTLFLISTVIIGLFHIFKSNYQVMNFLAEKIIRPALMTLSFATSVVDFSVAEALIAIAVIGTAVYLFCKVIALIKQKKSSEKKKTLYKIFMTPVVLVTVIYAGFCLLWGVYYYGDDFVAKTGLKNEKISAEQIRTVTSYFADLANEYSHKVKRNLVDVCEMDRRKILQQSDKIYRNLAETYPCMIGPDVKAKGVICSKVMSFLDFTGFFFPFTGEANVNMDAPSFMLPATVAHELAHCRGVAKEQEANFAAVLACMGYGDNEYIYSASLMAYNYLSAGLYKADPKAWAEINAKLNNDVKRDLAADEFYWKEYHTAAEKASNMVYEGFLRSYDQKLGLQSYGACVDLLVNYYYPLVAGKY